MIAFRPSVVISAGGEHVALKYVESISSGSDTESLVVTKLKDDITIDMITISGKRHTISMLQQIVLFSYTVDVLEMRDAIIDKWCRLMAE